MSVFKPRPWQDPMMDFALTHDRCCLFMPMGSGKTSAVLTVLDLLYSTGVETRPTLVVAPLRVARKVWLDEWKKWDHLRTGLSLVSITGTATERTAALQQVLGGNVQVATINYENLPWLMEALGARWPFGTVVADESVRLKGFRTKQGTQRAHALMAIAHTKVHRWINLTGTPSPNGLQDLWGQLWFIDGGRRLGNSYSAFVDRWFRRKGGADSFNQIEPMPFSDADIRRRIADVCCSVNLKDYIDIAEPFRVVVPVTLPADARKAYRTMERHFYAELMSGDIEAANAGVRSQKLMQFANGAVYVDKDQNWEEMHTVKLDALDSIINESGGAPVLVTYYFVSDLERLKRRYPQGRELKTERDEDDWNAGRIPLLFIHPQSAGHGLNLQDGGNILVRFGNTWNLEHHDQVLERIGPLRQMQSGHERPVFEYVIVAEDTVDEDIATRNTEKTSVQDALLAGLRHRTAGNF